MNFNIITLGCKVNQYESQAMSEMLINNGFEKATDPNKADITIINTCTVTAQSDLKCRQLVRKIKKLNPDCIAVAAYGKILPKEVLEIPKYGRWLCGVA